MAITALSSSSLSLHTQQQVCVCVCVCLCVAAIGGYTRSDGENGDPFFFFLTFFLKNCFWITSNAFKMSFLIVFCSLLAQKSFICGTKSSLFFLVFFNAQLMLMLLLFKSSVYFFSTNFFFFFLALLALIYALKVFQSSFLLWRTKFVKNCVFNN